MKEVERYIVEFLLYGNREAAKRVQISAPVDWTLRYPVLDEEAMGREGEKAIRRVPTSRDKMGEKAIVSPEVIYNTFFFISRAEELLNSERDEHGRFLARYSMLGEGNRLSTPIVDIYSQQLMKALDLPIPSETFGNVCLTHDIDTLDYYHHLRGAIGGIARGHWKEVVASLWDIKNDPAYTFQWMEEIDRYPQAPSARGMYSKANVEIIYFVKDTQGKGYDYPQYDIRRVPKLNAQYGLHSSYYGELPNRKVTHLSTPVLPPLNSRKVWSTNLEDESKLLHRSHYLRCSIEQMEKLVAYGVTDDYTMGFADKAGFRLQTSRPVRWINPKTMELTNLVLHPLTVMDCTLNNREYMNLNEEEAWAYCQTLFEQVRKYHGELVLLWHNTSMSHEYHRRLYTKVIESL